MGCIKRSNHRSVRSRSALHPAFGEKLLSRGHMSVSDVFTVADPARIPIPLLERYAAVRRTTEVITEGLTVEDQMVQSMPDASPTKWHLAHTSWFFETFILKPNLGDYRLFHD